MVVLTQHGTTFFFQKLSLYFGTLRFLLKGYSRKRKKTIYLFEMHKGLSMALYKPDQCLDQMGIPVNVLAC